jgi:hypothetical protein
MMINSGGVWSGAEGGGGGWDGWEERRCDGRGNALRLSVSLLEVISAMLNQ